MFKKFIVVAALSLTLLLHFLPVQSPPGFTADEAAFGYNAYSIAQTGKDEYGVTAPLRLKSFGDYKLPLYAYLTAPVVSIFGLNEVSTRVVAGISAAAVVLFIYLITRALFKNDITEYIALFAATFSPWIQTIARQSHETVLATALFAGALYLIVRFYQTTRPKYAAFAVLVLAISLFSYHTGKVIAPILTLTLLPPLIKDRKIFFKMLRSKLVLVCVLGAVFIGGLFLVGEAQTPAARVKSLFILNNQEITLKTQEAKVESRFSPFSIRAVAGAQAILKRYVEYFSPEFLTQHGDVNNRFGYPDITPISIVLYLGFIIGCAFLVKEWKREYGVLVALLVIAPFGGALTFQEYALTRVFPLVLAIIPLAAYGITQISSRVKLMLPLALGGICIGSFLSFYFFFIHYPKRAIVVRSMQAGYKELGKYIKTNYNRFDHFYITKDNGQPYIFMLFYLRYSPSKYQTVAQLSPPDEYGFGQVESFDKFIFSTDSFSLAQVAPRSVYIFSQYGGKIAQVPESSIKKIQVGTEQMFWIYEHP